MAFLWRWMKGTLDFLFPFLNKREKATLLFLGLGNAGKSTLMFRLKEDRVTQPVPTLHPYSEELQCGNITFTAYDVGGHKQVRRVWKTYFPVANGIAFIVDGSDKEKLGEANIELNRVLSDELIMDRPIAILINKIDKPNCMGEKEFIRKFELEDLVTGKDNFSNSDTLGRRPLEVFSCSVLQRQGYGTAFKWLANHLD